jgi:glucokinase
VDATPRRSDERVIGIDVGGTKIAAGAVDLRDGAVSFRCEAPTQAERGAVEVLADIASLAQDIARNLRRDGRVPRAVGIGVPEIVDAEGGIRSGHLLDWSSGSLSARLGNIAPVHIDADVRAAALAEALYGAGRAFRLFTYVSIGTGISSAIVQDGIPLVGARGGALVLSSGTLSVPCAFCGKWSAFVLEDYASGPALAHRYAAAIGEAVDGAETVIAAANAGKPHAIEVANSAATALGSAIGWLVNVVDPEAVVIGGGLGLAQGRFHDRLVASIRDHIWNPDARDLPLISASLGGDAGLIGAAASAYRSASPSVYSLGSPVAILNGERR